MSAEIDAKAQSARLPQLAHTFRQPLRARHEHAARGKKIADNVLGTRERQRAQCLELHSLSRKLCVVRRELIEQPCGLRRMLTGAQQGRPIGRITPRNHRQHLETHEVAIKRNIGVAVIFDPLELATARVRLDLTARYLKQRTEHHSAAPGPHAGSTRRRPLTRDICG